MGDRESNERRDVSIDGRAPSIRNGELILDRYRIERAIGDNGHMFAADDRHIPGRRVAVKLPAPAGYQASRARLVRERSVLATISSPTVVRLLDSGRSPFGPVLVMELLEGPTLRAALQHNSPMAPARVASIAYDLACALACCHAAGFVHLAVRPGNVILVPGGAGNEIAKLIDFGMATTVASATNDQDDDVGGGPPGDIRALGVVMCEMLAGRVPAKEANDLGGEGKSELRPAQIGRLSEAYDRLWAVVQTCLRESTESRPTARNLVATLRELRCDCPIDSGRTPAAITGGAASTREDGR